MPKLILVVDDDAGILEMTRRTLERAGHMVVACKSGRDALAALDAARFDVVITDIFMPEMDGFELIHEICRRDSDTAIIAVSGGSTVTLQDFLPIAGSLGADLMLSKPVPPARLLLAVETVAVDRSKGLRRALAKRYATNSARISGHLAV